jgi:hypothetical protein
MDDREHKASLLAQCVGEKELFFFETEPATELALVLKKREPTKT